MYVSKINDESGEREKALDFMKNNGFALLVTNDANGFPHATHLPLMIEQRDDEKLFLVGHLARANFVWQNWEKTTESGENVKALAVFSGSHAFISSSWYEKSNVSTWNYLSVHATGHVRIVREAARMKEMLKNLTNHYESGMKTPRNFESLGDDYVTKEMRGLVCFEMAVEKLEFAAKLSQNRNDRDYQNIVKELEETQDPNAAQIAEEMKIRRPEL